MKRKLSPSVKRFRDRYTPPQDVVAGSIRSERFLGGGMKKLAKHHCSSVAIGIVCLVAVSAGMPDGLGAQERSQTQVGPASSDASGRRTFGAQCSPCHGLDGRGGEHAPSIVQDQVKSMSDEDLVAIVRHGIPTKGMPEFGSLGPAAIKSVVAYLREMQGASTSEIVLGDATRGRTLFFGKAGCSACHVMEGSGNFIAADLSDYGRNHQPSEIRDAILKPEKLGDSPPEQATVTTRSGTRFSGVVRNEDNFSLQIQDAHGEFYLIVKSDALRIRRAPMPGMPGDYSERLTPQEVDDLVTYIAQRSTN
jgi:cytochrome c oxidase cbb3-type subunit III